MTTTMVPDLAVGVAGTMANVLETGRVEDLSSEGISAALGTCAFLQDLFAQARRSIEGRLSHGVDASAFATKYERAVTDLEGVLTTAQRVVAKARTRPLSPPVELFVSKYDALMNDMLSLH